MSLCEQLKFGLEGKKKHGGGKRKCSLPAFFPFPTMLLNVKCLREARV